jgi:FAD/FMN-containing dehydrogenase
VAAPAAGAPGSGGFVARGLGRSYGDSATNAGGGVILQERLDRLIDFDPQAGVLECEAGVSLATIVEHFLPRGFFLPVTPGTKFVTVGGAIAADVHGKNHHVDGTFGRAVESLRLLTANGDVITCSAEQEPEIFWATVGGMGLTGVILSARFRMLPVQSAYINVRYDRAANLDRALELFGSSDATHRYSVAWIDCLSSGASLGRSVLMRGDHVPAADLPGPYRADPLAVSSKRKKKVPFNFPGWALNTQSVRLFNATFYARHGDGDKIVDYDTFFYPLDGVLHWNRIYGKRGFIQYQALIPPEKSRAALVELLEKLSASGMSSFLAVLKATGPANPGMLSFPFPGHTLALDLPNTGESLIRLVASLDAILLRHGGRLYLAKDSVMSRQTFEAMYPELPHFKQVKARLDPGQIFVSSQARRLGITEAA